MNTQSSPIPNRPRVAVISYSALSRLIHSVTDDYRNLLEIKIINAVFNEGVKAAQELLDKGEIDIVMSAGANGEYLRDALDVPVVLVEVSGYDLLAALQRARRLDNRIAIVTYRKVSQELEDLKDLLNLELTQLSYDTPDDARVKFQQLKDGGYRVVVGASLVTELAEQAGMTPVFLYSRHSIRRTFEDVLQIAEVKRKEKARQQRLEILLENVQAGVLAVDRDERIDVINSTMAGLLGTTPAWAQGKHLRDLAPEPLRLGKTLQSGKDELGVVEKIGSRRIVLNRIPISQDGIPNGAVLTFQDVSRIQELDRSFRSGRQPSQFTARYTLDEIVGDCPTIRSTKESARLFASTGSTVLLLGESGTGKEMFAQGIHNASDRANGPFVALNCAAFPESLLESELFGYEEGAFSGSRRGGKIGLIESAHQGTLFLDEIGDMPLAAQTRLLRVLQEKEVLRLGAHEPTRVDIRVIAATHRDLRELAAQGKFREDLYYRLNIFSLSLPSLRQRLADLEPLSWSIYASLKNRHGYRLDDKNFAALLERLQPHFQRYNWPGNVRELENVIERATLFCLAGSDRKLGDEELLQLILPELQRDAPTSVPEDEPVELVDLTRKHERAYILEMIQKCGGNQAEAARRLGISRTTLWRKLSS